MKRFFKVLVGVVLFGLGLNPPYLAGAKGRAAIPLTLVTALFLN